MSEYRIHAARTGFGTQTRIIVMRRPATKWDDVLCPNAAVAKRRLREYRAEYGVRHVSWGPVGRPMEIREAAMMVLAGGEE